MCIEFKFFNACLFIPGPAGTGKTESVKALGNQMGRFVLVFNCDETFDFQVSSWSLLQYKDIWKDVLFIGNGPVVFSGYCYWLYIHKSMS